MNLDPKLHRVVVFVSTELPDDARARLMQMVKRHDWLFICAVPPTKKIPHKAAIQQFIDDLGIIGPYAHVRLDDDDALMPTFAARLSRYIDTQYIGKAVSFVRGFNAYFEVEREIFTEAVEVEYPMNAQGLSFIGSTDAKPLGDIYSLGNHTRIDEKVPVILDATEALYVRTIHCASDTGLHDKLRGRFTSMEDLKLLLPTFPERRTE